MLFNSPEFVIFLLFVYLLYIVLPFRQQNLMLLVMSYIFYGWWDPRFLFLVALSTTVDYWVGLVLDRGRLTQAQRLIPAAFLLTSGLLFLCVDITAAVKGVLRAEPSRDLIRPDMIPIVLGGIAAYLLILHLIYRRLEGFPRKNSRLSTLMVSLISQLGLLGVFKYFNFFADSFQNLLQSLGAPAGGSSLLNIILPVGISFYTFQSLSYTIDIYRRQFKPTDSFLDFALFVSYFPQLQAGPIERGRQLIPQLARPRILSFEQSIDGLYLILLGFFKKTAIADGVAPVVDQVFGSTGHVSWIDIVIGSLLFSIQIYCDFSGYIDIARGVSKLLGIELVKNFDHPYFSTSAREFWRRWNISLSSWLRDYVYISLGGSAGNLAYICRNLMLTMLLGGLWHGAAWNFVLWGFYQGALLCINRIWTEVRTRRGLPDKSPETAGANAIFRRVFANMFFFVFVCYGWLIFRAHSLSQVVDFTSRLFTDFGNLDYGLGAPRLSSVIGILILLVLETAQFVSGNEYFYRGLSRPLRGMSVAALLVAIVMGMSNEPAQFIYFQF